MSGWWIHEFWQQGRATELAAWIFWVIASITLHELAHGWAALAEGDDTPRVRGHLTANPVVHMGVPSLVIFALVGIAWGLMPVNPSRFRHGRMGRVLVAGAGPAMNIALAFAALLAVRAVDPGSVVATFLYVGGYLNIVLAILNLLPIPPLDGATILANLVPAAARLYARPQAMMLGFFLLVMIFVSGAGSVLFDAAGTIASAIAGLGRA